MLNDIKLLRKRIKEVKKEFNKDVLFYNSGWSLIKKFEKLKGSKKELNGGN